MAVKDLITSYFGTSTHDLKVIRKGLVQKGNALLKKHEYFQVELIKEEIEMIDIQLKQNKYL